LDWKNTLYFGDNLEVLRANVPNESVDLIYLDPPFNSNANYNVLFAEKSGEKSAAQIHAFEDTWGWGLESEAAYNELVTQGPKKLADLMQALLAFLGRNDMMAYLVMMAIRLVELHRVLKSTGSIYLHCDDTASHYLKLLMDAVFGPLYFQNQIVWKRTTAHNDPERCGRNTDILLFYGRGERKIWNAIYRPHGEEYLERFRHRDPDGRRWADDNLTGAGRGPSRAFGEHGEIAPPAGRHWMHDQAGIDRLIAENRIHWTKAGLPRLKTYMDEAPGVPLQCLWEDIPPINSQAQERLGYPTQKPEALLERIIKASSNEGDVVLDPFCGCGTAIAVAERLKRRWIGIDVTYLAINLVQRRLRDTFGVELGPYQIIGAPKDVAGAEELKKIDPYQFEWWAVDLVDARPARDRKKGADSGVDGYINFLDDKSGVAKKVIVQVKSGYVGVNHVRDLKGVLEREKAVIGALITLREPTKPMLTEAASAGFYKSENFPEQYPRLQILTIKELLDGKQLLFPRHRVETFKKAERKSKAQQDDLF